MKYLPSNKCNLDSYYSANYEQSLHSIVNVYSIRIFVMVCVFLSERECSFGYTYIAVRDPSMNKGGGGVSGTYIILPSCCSCPTPRPGFPTRYVVVFVCVQ